MEDVAASKSLLTALTHAETDLRGMEGETFREIARLFREGLHAKLDTLIAAPQTVSNAAKVKTGLRRLLVILLNAFGVDPRLPDDLAEVVPKVVAFPAASPYDKDYAHFYCESAAELHAFFTILERGGTRASYNEMVERLKSITRKALRNEFGAAITRVACVSLFPTPHESDPRDFGVIFSLTNNPDRVRQTLDKSALQNCAYWVSRMVKENGEPQYRVPRAGSDGGYRKRKRGNEDPTRNVRPRLEEPPVAGLYVEPIGEMEAGAPPDGVTEVPFDIGAFLLEEPYPPETPRVRGPAEEEAAIEHALCTTLLACLQRAPRRTIRFIFGGAEDDLSDWSEYSDTDDDDEDAEEHVCASPNRGVMRLHLRGADPVTEWWDANEKVVTFNSFTTEAGATIRNLSRTRFMEARMLTWSKGGFARHNLGNKKGKLVLKPGEVFTMKNTDNSLIISGPEDDAPLEGYFLLFYQETDGKPDGINPKWYVAAQAYRLLPEEASPA